MTGTMSMQIKYTGLRHNSRVISQYMGNDKFAVTPAPLKSALINDIPEIKSATKCKFTTHTLEYNASLFSGDIFLYADTDFLRIFTFPVSQGQSRSVSKGAILTFHNRKNGFEVFWRRGPCRQDSEG